MKYVKIIKNMRYHKVSIYKQLSFNILTVTYANTLHKF